MTAYSTGQRNIVSNETQYFVQWCAILWNRRILDMSVLQFRFGEFWTFFGYCIVWRILHVPDNLISIANFTVIQRFLWWNFSDLLQENVNNREKPKFSLKYYLQNRENLDVYRDSNWILAAHCEINHSPHDAISKKCPKFDEKWNWRIVISKICRFRCS